MRISWTLMGASAAGDIGMRDVLDCVNGLGGCERSDGDAASRSGSYVTVAVTVKTKEQSRVLSHLQRFRD